MLRRVALVRTDVSEELSTSIIRVTRIGELGTTLVVTSNVSVSVGSDASHVILLWSRVECTTDGQSASTRWCRAAPWGP
jgi:hypothetical protein